MRLKSILISLSLLFLLVVRVLPVKAQQQEDLVEDVSIYMEHFASERFDDAFAWVHPRVMMSLPKDELIHLLKQGYEALGLKASGFEILYSRVVSSEGRSYGYVRYRIEMECDVQLFSSEQTQLYIRGLEQRPRTVSVTHDAERNKIWLFQEGGIWAILRHLLHRRGRPAADG